MWFKGKFLQMTVSFVSLVKIETIVTSTDPHADEMLNSVGYNKKKSISGMHAVLTLLGRRRGRTRGELGTESAVDVFIW